MGTHIRTYPPLDCGRAWTGKFLQLALDGTSWLLFAGADPFRYHNQILAAFLDEHGVAHRWRGREVLEYDRQRVRVAGGGRFDLDLDSATLEVWDNSTAYGRFHEELVTQQLAATDPPWSVLSVRIRPEAG